MPDRVKSFFEIYKTSIDLFVVIMNVLIYQGSESEDVVCSAVIRAFPHEVTAVILVFQNNETAAMLVYLENPLGVELFSHVNAFFCSNKLA